MNTARTPKLGEAKHGAKTIRRRDLKVRVRAQAGHPQTSSPPDPAVVAETKRRFAICKACEHSNADGFACEFYDGCCFGRFRAGLTNACPVSRW